VIDAAVNCTAVVHLPGKRALSCTMKNAATMRDGLSAHVRADGVRCRTCGRGRAAQAVIAPCTATSTADCPEFLRSHLVRHAADAIRDKAPVIAAPRGDAGDRID
jgi:3-polyprenyl-4-hydroxybenzoate decarboxylase